MVINSMRQVPVCLPSCDGLTLEPLTSLEQPIWVYDFGRHRMAWCNAAALKFWNATSLTDLQQRDFTPVAHGTAQRMNNLQRRIADGETVEDTWTLYPLGNPRQIKCTFTGIHLADGSVGMIVAAAPDTLARSQSPQSDTSALELRTIEAVRHTPLMISMVTPTGHWLMHNPAAEQLMLILGVLNAPLVDNYLAIFADRKEAADLRDTALAEGSAEATLRMAGEDYRMHDVTLRRLADPVSGRLSLMLSQQDVTRAYRLDRQLKEALANEQTINESQRQFVLFTSHNFRTPLAIIDGAARRIGKLLPDNEALHERLRDIRRATQRMVGAVDKTLATARLAEGDFGITLQRCDLKSMLVNAVSCQLALQPDRQFALTCEDLPPLQIDPSLFEQVLENLLSNAVKYSPVDKPIEVDAIRESERVRITITDHGIGIPAQDLPKLFTRFFRCSNVGAIRGTGVGLHAVRHFMELHGGTVVVSSVEGKGAVVTLTLPVD